MKVTAFFPVILYKDLDEGLKEYEAMGFERKHSFENFAMKSHVMEINGNQIGEISQRLYDELTGIQWGRLPDERGWIVKVC